MFNVIYVILLSSDIQTNSRQSINFLENAIIINIQNTDEQFIKIQKKINFKNLENWSFDQTSSKVTKLFNFFYVLLCSKVCGCED